LKRTTAFAIAGTALACGVINLVPGPLAPVNTCNDITACEGTFPEAGIDAGVVACVGGACSGGGFAPILVVTMPLELATIVTNGPAPPPGSTVAIPSSRLQEIDPEQPRPGGACAVAATRCVSLPPFATGSDGYLNVNIGVARPLWPPNGLRPNESDNSSNPTTLPVTVTFHPMWLDPATNTTLPATKLGLPLADVLGTEGTAFPLFAPTNSDASRPPQGCIFQGTIPQPYAPSTLDGLNLDPAQFYTLEVVPIDPFAVFPPFIGPRNPNNGLVTPLSVAALQYQLAPSPFDLHQYVPLYDVLNNVVFPHPSPPNAYHVGELPGAPSLAGWHVYVVNADGHRVSGTVTLPGGPDQPINIYEATETNGQPSETLFIDPPTGVDLPRYTVTSIGGIIQGPDFDYPALPALTYPYGVTVSGFVRRADTLATATARISFVVDGTNTFVAGTDGTSTQTGSLIYSKNATTIAAGQYATLLPPGVFRVYVMPDDDGLALTVTDSQPVTMQGGSGQTLFVNPRTHVKGRVVLGNGTPVYAADVVIGASADAPFMPNIDTLALPRESRGTTDENGFFDVLADPGPVDISIRPRDGTNYPWVVLTNRNVLPNNPADGGLPSVLTLADVVVPLPSIYQQGTASEVLTDSNGIALPHAVVRAYAFPPPFSASDAGTTPTRGARLIGATVTDDNAAFQLFVTPPQ